MYPPLRFINLIILSEASVKLESPWFSPLRVRERNREEGRTGGGERGGGERGGKVREGGKEGRGGEGRRQDKKGK